MGIEEQRRGLGIVDGLAWIFLIVGAVSLGICLIMVLEGWRWKFDLTALGFGVIGAMLIGAALIALAIVSIKKARM